MVSVPIARSSATSDVRLEHPDLCVEVTGLVAFGGVAHDRDPGPFSLAPLIGDGSRLSRPAS